MRSRTKIILALGAVVLLAVVISQNESGPSYKGRSLKHWVESSLQYLGGADSAHQPAEWVAAIRHYDTNAIPYLLKWIQETEPTPKSWLYRTVTELRVRAGIRANSPLGKEEVLGRGVAQAFGVLGPRAECAIPELVRILDYPGMGTGLSRKQWTLNALRAIGPAAYPAMINAFTNQSLWHKKHILHTLAEYPVIMPAIMKAYTNQSLSHNKHILDALFFRTNNQALVSWLLGQTISYDKQIAQLAGDVLKNYESKLVLDSLSAGITNGQDFVRLEGVRIAAFTDFGEESSRLIPALRQVLSSETNLVIRSYASNALYHIELRPEGK